VSIDRGIRRKLASLAQAAGGKRSVMLALGLGAVSVAGVALAQGLSDQQIRCMQLQQDLASSVGGGASGDDVARIDQQIAQADRVFQGTQAAMEDAGCYQRLFIFGRALVRSPQCLKMNDRVEGARRQLSQLQQQRNAMTGGSSAKRRQAEVQQALARAGCGGQVRPARRGGGLFDFFGGRDEPEEPQYQSPIYRNIDPGGRYRTVCVRLCDGFYYPISYSTYGSRVAQDAERCQANCAAPAELYVYRNPGQEIEQAISLQGSAYMDLPVALKFRKEYVKGCSCKQAEYNPTEIEQAAKRAEADTTAATAKGKPKKVAAPAPKAPAPDDATQAAAPADTAASGAPPQLDLDITGSTATLPIEPPKPQAANPPAPPTPAAPPAPAATAQGDTGVSPGSTIIKKAAPAPH
jgi:hypothetical protein